MSARKQELQDRAIVKIAAHLPDLIVYGDFSPERPSVKCFDGVLMFVDISGKCQGGCLFNVGEQQAHIGSPTRVVTAVGWHHFQSPRLLEQQNCSSPCAHRKEGTTSDADVSHLPFLQLSVTGTSLRLSRFLSWTSGSSAPRPNFIAWSPKSHIYL